MSSHGERAALLRDGANAPLGDSLISPDSAASIFLPGEKAPNSGRHSTNAEYYSKPRESTVSQKSKRRREEGTGAYVDLEEGEEEGEGRERRGGREEEEEEEKKVASTVKKTRHAWWHPTRFVFRWTFLLWACLLSFGSYYSYDTPSALQTTIQDTLHISTTQYQVLYLVYSIPNTVMAFFGGFLIDRVFGIRFGGFLYSAICTAGQCVFAFGASIKSYALMVVGRAFFGIGGESISVAQNLYVTRTFSGKELAMALGITLSISRLGSAINQDVTPPLATATSMATALWFAGILCGISSGVGVVAAWFDRIQEKARREERRVSSPMMSDEEFEKEELARSKAGDEISLLDVRFFPLSLWLVFLICVFFYCAVFPFFSVANDFFIDRYHLSKDDAGHMASIPYTVSAVVSPVFGFVVDRVGYKPYFLLFSSTGMIAVHIMLLFTNVTPYVPMITLGFMYSMCAAALWPCVPEVVKPEIVGTAYGLMTAVQNAGVAAASPVVGALSDGYGYPAVIQFFIASTSAATLLSVWLIIEDVRTGWKLSRKSTESVEVGQRLVTISAHTRPEAAAAAAVAEARLEAQRATLIKPKSAVRIRSGYFSRIGIGAPRSNVFRAQNRSGGDYGSMSRAARDLSPTSSDEQHPIIDDSRSDDRGRGATAAPLHSSAALPQRQPRAASRRPRAGGVPMGLSTSYSAAVAAPAPGSARPVDIPDDNSSGAPGSFSPQAINFRTPTTSAHGTPVGSAGALYPSDDDEDDGYYHHDSRSTGSNRR